MNAPQLYYYLDEARQQQGPVTPHELRGLADSGRLTPITLVWCEGWEDWRQATSVPGLFAAPPTAAQQAFVQSPRSPWGIRAMPPPSYLPESFTVLFWWWAVTSLTHCLLLTAWGLILLVAVLSGRGGGDPDEQILVVIGLGWIVLVLISIVPTVLWCVLLYRAWRQIQDGYAETGPGKAVGFLFLPFFNYYWFFVAVWGLAKDLRAYADRYGIAGVAASPGLALATAITTIAAAIFSICLYFLFVPIAVAVYVLWLITTYQLATSSRAVAAYHAAADGRS